MALKGMEFCLVLVLAAAAAMLSHKAVAQSGCTTVLVGLAPCLNYITGNSSTPAQSCCSQLANVVQSQPQCLCSLLNGGGSSLGISINQTKALSLPGACNVQTPPVSQCNAANNGPASSPVSPPVNSSDDTPNAETPTSPSMPKTPSSGTGGSKTVPTTTTSVGSPSSGSINTVTLPFTAFVLFMASCFSIAIKI